MEIEERTRRRALEMESGRGQISTRLVSGITRWASEAMIATLPLTSRLFLDTFLVRPGVNQDWIEGFTPEIFICAMILSGMSVVREIGHDPTTRGPTAKNYILFIANTMILILTTLAYALSSSGAARDIGKSAVAMLATAIVTSFLSAVVRVLFDER